MDAEIRRVRCRLLALLVCVRPGDITRIYNSALLVRFGPGYNPQIYNSALVVRFGPDYNTQIYNSNIVEYFSHAFQAAGADDPSGASPSARLAGARWARLGPELEESRTQESGTQEGWYSLDRADGARDSCARMNSNLKAQASGPFVYWGT